MFFHFHFALGVLASTAFAAQPNYFAGTWNLTALTWTLSNGTVTNPIGTRPYGRLILTPGLFYIVQFNTGDYVSHPWDASPTLFTPGSAAENAALVTNSLASSGVYEVNASGDQVIRTTRQGSTVPNFIDMSSSPPDQTFQLLQQGQKMLETINWGDGSFYEFFWDRAEVIGKAG